MQEAIYKQDFGIIAINNILKYVVYLRLYALAHNL